MIFEDDENSCWPILYAQKFTAIIIGATVNTGATPRYNPGVNDQYYL
jgi:hypothetical protein